MFSDLFFSSFSLFSVYILYFVSFVCITLQYKFQGSVGEGEVWGRINGSMHWDLFTNITVSRSGHVEQYYLGS